MHGIVVHTLITVEIDVVPDDPIRVLYADLYERFESAPVLGRLAACRLASCLEVVLVLFSFLVALVFA